MTDGDVQEPQPAPQEEPRPQPQGEPRELVTEPRPPRSRWRVAAGVAVVVVVVAVVLLAPVAATSSSTYCGSCHAMTQAYTTWQRGPHSSVPCAKCHIPPGTVEAVKWRTTEARNIWLSYLNMKPAKASQPLPATENCLKCHPLNGLMGVPGKIRMPHAQHVIQNNLDCVDCHVHTAHAAPGQSDAVSMAICTMCHEETSDPSKCTFCHYTSPVSGKAHPTDYIAEHGKLALDNEQVCYRCHHNKVQFCDACHNKPTPGHYSADWPYVHGKQAEKDPASCLGCHTRKQLCNQCHTVDHPSDWATSHASVALKGTRSCLVCHPKRMCTDCHTAKGISLQETFR